MKGKFIDIINFFLKIDDSVSKIKRNQDNPNNNG